MPIDRRQFLAIGGAAALGSALACRGRQDESHGERPVASTGPVDYTLRISTGLAQVATRVYSTTLYNNQFPGPLLRFREGRPVTIDIYNDTEVPEQLHWHGQLVGVDVDGAAEEGTPFIPARGHRRITFTPGPAGLRFYHTHATAGLDLGAGLYSGQAGIVYIEPKDNAGRYDQEVFLLLKEFGPTLTKNGEMEMDFLSPSTRGTRLQAIGEASMQASIAKNMPFGYEVEYRDMTINGQPVGYGEPIRVKPNERVLIHAVNASATAIRSLALPGHTFQVLALDGNAVPTAASVPVIWIAPGERVTALVTMDHPGKWILGDVGEDRYLGMGTVVEYAGANGGTEWVDPPTAAWDYTRFGQPGATSATPDQTIDMTFTEENAATNGFNRWLINGVAFSMNGMKPMFTLRHGRRYRLRMRNASDDVHPIHLHRHIFELTKIAGRPTAGIMKDVVMVGSYQEVEVDFVANSLGLSLFHCHMQTHMDFGFMALFDCK